ncbi:MAG: hypothetical protein PHY99_08935 [Bacteroidales bacterium]|nr:hypothetical protein [Bacteroidales bacterium]
MKTVKFIPVLLTLFATMLMPAFGQHETDKKKQEEAMKKHQERVTIITNSQKGLQKAMAESIANQEKALNKKKEMGIVGDEQFLQQAAALQDYKMKLDELKSTGENWEPQTYYGISPKMKLQNDAYGMAEYSIFSADRENSSLSISKTLEDVTFTTDFKYDVKEGSSRISFFVTGSLKVGELKIVMKKPDESTFQEITISPLADVNWNQQFKWEEENAEEYLGTWMISISAAKANGTYRVQINSR